MNLIQKGLTERAENQDQKLFEFPVNDDPVVNQYVEAGKVDNCQVAVHASLANGKFCTLVGTKLFLPDGWTKDKKRCEAAGIPDSEQKFQTKPGLALKLIKQIIQVIFFFWG